MYVSIQELEPALARDTIRTLPAWGDIRCQILDGIALLIAPNWWTLKIHAYLTDTA